MVYLILLIGWTIFFIIIQSNNSFLLILGPTIDIFMILLLVRAILRYKNSYSVQNKIIVITGSSMGIGEHVVRKLASKGAKLVLAARSANRLDTIAKDLQLSYPNIELLVIPTDITKRESIDNLISKTLERFDKIDVLVNCSGLGINKSFLDISNQDIDTIYDVNLKGLVYITRTVLPIMLNNTGAIKGEIINVSSTLGLKGTSGFTLYCSAKSAVITLTEGLIAEFDRLGIKTSVILPGPVKSHFSDNILGEKYKPMGVPASWVGNKIVAVLEQGRSQKRVYDTVLALLLGEVFIRFFGLFVDIFMAKIVPKPKPSKTINDN